MGLVNTAEDRHSHHLLADHMWGRKNVIKYTTFGLGERERERPCRHFLRMWGSGISDAHKVFVLMPNTRCHHPLAVAMCNICHPHADEVHRFGSLIARLK